MSTINIFEAAARKKLRFESVRGSLPVEVLFDLPLTASNGLSLDAIARTINGALKELTEESFVETTTNPLKGELELKLELVKFVIADKQARLAAERDAAARKAEREKLLAILATKEEAALNALSTEEIRKRLEALG